MVFGLTDKGFKAKDFSTIKQEIETALREHVDPSLHFGPGSVAGMLTGIVAYQSRQVWEALHGLYHSLQPDSATGRALDALCSLTGTRRRLGTLSKAKALVTLAANTSVPIGSRIKTIGGDFFITTAKVTNSAHNEAQGQVDLIAENVGPKMAHDGTPAEIMTPVVGWSSVSIITTYEIGQSDETDDELRLRRIDELRATGSSTKDAMTARLREVSGVDAVYIKEGEHNFEVFIKGGTETDIAHTMWRCKPLGVKTEGTISHKITDGLKQERVVKFSRPKLIPLSLQTTIKVTERFDETPLKTALADFARMHFTFGAEVYSSRFFSIILAHQRVLDVTSLQVRDRTSGSTVPTIIKEDEIACLNFKDIAIEQIVEVRS